MQRLSKSFVQIRRRFKFCRIESGYGYALPLSEYAFIGPLPLKSIV